MTTTNQTQPSESPVPIPLRIPLVDALRMVARSLNDNGDGDFADVVRQGADTISELVAAHHGERDR